MEHLLALIAIPEVEMFLKLFTALFLGMSLGLERALAQKTAGMRTYGLVSMGAALFIIIAVTALKHFDEFTALHQSIRMAAQIVTGIGFIGAGLIFFKGETVSGVTTAAGIWVAAGIGMAVGYGLFGLALMATLLVLMAFTLFWFAEERIRDTFLHRDHHDTA